MTTSLANDERASQRLHRLAAALGGALGTADIVAAIVAHTSDAFGASGTVIARRSDDGEQLELLGASDMTEEAGRAWQRFPLAAPVPLAVVARTGQPLFLESRADWKRQFPDLVPLVEQAGHHANIVVPLLVQGAPSGSLGVAFDAPRAFDPEERAMAMTVARQCSVALERARLFEAERAARTRAEALALQLDAARAAAESANRAKLQFLAMMSHEFRTPLQAIAGYVEVLEMEIHGPVNSPQREALGRVRHSGDHLLRLIDQILQFAKVETGSVQFNLGDISLARTLDFVEEMVAPQIHARGLHFARALPDDLPLVRADPDKLRQIIVNLLSNAIKFTAAGGTIAIRGARDDPGAAVLLHVTDTGCGIPHGQLERAFEPFVQLNRRLSRPSEGAGLGLAISRDLARAMGGDLTVESTPGVGSTFTVRLPRAG